MKSGSAFLLLAILSSAACSGPYSEKSVAAVETPPLPVKVIRTAHEAIPEIITVTGELLAEEQATIGVRVPGRVTRLHVDLGSVVNAGDVLAEIDKEDYAFRVSQAEALVNQTRARLGILDSQTDDVTPENTAIVRRAAADLKEAAFIYQTTEKLAEEGIVSKIDFERAGVRRQASEAAYQEALEEVMQLRAQLSERRAQLSLARQNLEDCVIRAPFAGAITQRIASIGEYLPVNAPVATLVRQHPLRLRLEVPERAAGKVRIGQRVDVRLEGAGSGHSGVIARISPAINNQARSMMAEGDVANDDGKLKPGTFAEAVITVDPDATGLAVPRDTVLSFAGIERVFVVSGGQLEDRVIKTGRILAEDRVEVLEGLQPGLDIVRDVSDRLAVGQQVSVQ